MSSIVRPPDPHLVAIFLVIRSRAGPRFVFHYPPNPLSENAQNPTTASKSKRASRNEPGYVARSGDSTSSTDDDDDSRSSSDEDEDEAHLLHGLATTSGTGTNTGNKRMSSFAPLDENVSAASTAGGGVSNVGGGGGGGGGEPQRPGSLGSGRTSLRRRGGQHSDADDESTGGAAATSDRRDHISDGTSISHSEVLGLTPDVWEKLLSPSRSWHKRRFEVGINDLAFVGWPVFVRDDGTWRKQKRKKKKKTRREWESAELGHNEQVEDAQGEEGNTDEGDHKDTNGKRAARTDPEWEPEPSGSDDLLESSDGDKDSMTMFNVVFVLDPPLLGHSSCIKDMYDNIIKKFAKALKWEQARSDFIWRESQLIMHLKEKARDKKLSVNSLYSDLIARSTLARAICTVYSSISASKIASVSLSQQVSISLQIPPLTSTSYLPGPNDTAYPGLWLTTADSVTPADDPTADTNAAPHQVLAKHFALLLLDNSATILKDIESSGGALAPALAHYIRCSKPTKSFAQISASSGIPLPTIQMLASHLVYWRRARAIPPLHQRDTYIVSPNCDLSKLEAASASYAATFPTQPSLPKMLAALSGTPKPYGSFIPSKEHKDTYFAILAWLLRGGWVTQLRAFARVKVTPEIKMAAEKTIRREEVDKYLNRGKMGSISSEDSNADSYRRRYRDRDDDLDETSSSSSSSLASHGSGEETPVPHRHHLAEHELHLSHSMLDQTTLLDVSSLILVPHRASPLESRWLDEIMARFPDGHGFRLDELTGNASSAEANATIGGGVGNGGPNGLENAGLQASLKVYWPAFVKYFNGTDALEKIPVREGLKRKLVWQVLMRLGLVTGQQLPIELDPKEQVLVSVRHW